MTIVHKPISLPLPFVGKIQHSDDKMQHNVYSVRGRAFHIHWRSDRKFIDID